MKKRLKLITLICVAALVLCAAVFSVACGSADTYTLTFSAEGQTYKTVTAEAGAAVEEIPDPSSNTEGNVFEGWYTDPEFAGEKAVIPTVMPNENRTYYAKFVRYAKLIISNGGGYYSKEYSVPVGTDITAYLADKTPTVDGLVFGGYFIDNAELAAGAAVGAEGVTVTAKFKVSYTVNTFKQNTLGTYPAEGEKSSALGWVDEKLDASAVSVAHFSVDTEKTEFITLAKGGENVFNAYVKRNTYGIVYNANAPEDTEPTGEIDGSSALYEIPVTVRENAYKISGYRFAGWSTAPNGEVDKAYESGKPVLLTRNVMLYAQWDKGYTDRFGGGDIIYIPRDADDKVYLERNGLEEKTGTYDKTTGVFVFTHEAGELKGRISVDGSFAYYGEENPGTYKLVNAFDSSISPDGVTLTLDNYDGATVKEKDGTEYEGRYAIDDESGDFVFYGDEAMPEKYREFYFTLGNIGTTDELGFAIRGDEYGIHYSYLATGEFTTPIMMLDGYGTAAVMRGSSTVYGMYVFADDYDVSNEIIISVLAYYRESGQYYISEELTARLDGKVDAVNTVTGEQTVVGLFTMRDAYKGTYSGGDSSPALVLDGYGSGKYGTATVDYTVTDGVAVFTVNGKRTVLKLDNKTFVYDAQVGAEQGSYYLYLPHEDMPYTTTLYLDGQGNAVWYSTGKYSSTVKNEGTYEYNAETGIAVCTSDNGEFKFLLAEINWHNGVYRVYMRPTELDGEYSSATLGKLVLDGYGYATLGTQKGTYDIETRSGYDKDTEKFVIFYVDTQRTHTFLINTEDAGRTFVETDYTVGEYSEFKYYEDKMSFMFGTYSLVLKDNGKATLFDQPKSWEPKKLVGDGTYAYNAQKGVYTFTLDDGVEAEESVKSFEFILTQTGNGSRVFKTFNALIGGTYISEDGFEKLEFDGYGNAAYSDAGTVVVSSAYEYRWGVYVLKDGTGDDATEYMFVLYEKGDDTYVKRAGDEARIYTLFDPTGEERQQIIINGNGDAELYAYNADKEGYESKPFVKGTYAKSDREGEWIFVSADKTKSPDFKFILPDDTQIISFMKYDENADGRFYCNDWTVLTVDGYSGHYTGASYIDVNGVVYNGTYTTEGNVIVFASDTSTFYLKLLDAGDDFKRLGDERGEYMYYNPVAGSLYSMPAIMLDGEGGATLTFSATESIVGRYAQYGDSQTEYTFVYTDEESGESVTFRFRTALYNNYKTFMLHNDSADGTFTGADGKLVIDGYSNGVYTDNSGVVWTGFYVSCDEIPNSDGNEFLVSFVGIKEGGSVSNEEDLIMFSCKITQEQKGFKRVRDEAAFYNEYRPATMGVYNLYLLLDGDGNAYLQNPDNGGAYMSGTYTLNLDTAEGEFTIDGVTTPFRLTVIQTSLSSMTQCFIRYNEDWAGKFTSATLGKLELDGYGEATYTTTDGESGDEVVYNGILTIYETEYITEPTVVFTVVVDGYANGELFFKLNRTDKTFREAGEEANYYYGYRVDSLGGTYVESVRLLLDGDGKAELYDVTDAGFELNAKGTYVEKSRVESESGNVTVTYTFTAVDTALTFDFQFRYVQEYFMGGLVPCFVRHDAEHAKTYTATVGDVTHTLALDGYELATYTYTADGGETTTLSGTYSISYSNTDQKTTVSFVARNEKGQSIATATFAISADGSLEIISPLKEK